jgi:hypothetical protein
MPALWAATTVPAFPIEHLLADEATLPSGVRAAAAVSPTAAVVGRMVAAHRAGITPESTDPRGAEASTGHR